MNTLETRITEVLAAHDFRIKEEIGAHVGVKTIVCNCGNRYGLGESHRAHQAAALAPVIREAQAEALKAEATNLRELHTLIEDTPWNPMPAEDKVRCTEFMAESGVDDHEYTDRHLNNYAAWLDHRAEQIRSKDE